MYERHVEPLLPRREFFRRVAGHAALVFAIVAGSLGLGTLGYRLTQGMPWLDALLNASMILTGMGPVTPLETAAAKLFASMYALYSGLVFVAVNGILVAPFAHRILHQLHLTRK